MTTTVTSPFRPLTRSARRALEDYGIVEITSSCEDAGPETIVVKERPPREVLEEHELRLDRDPSHVYKGAPGDRVLVFEDDDEVRHNGSEAPYSPEETHERARP